MINNLLADFSNYIVDIIVIAVILISAIVCLKKGFIRCLFGFASTVISIILAIFLTRPIISATNGLFGLTEKIGNEILCYFIGFFAVFILTKLLTVLISKMLSSFVDKIPVVGKLNHGLGFVLGLAQGFLSVCAVVAVLKLIQSTNLFVFVENTVFVKWLYNANPLYAILTWLGTL